MQCCCGRWLFGNVDGNRRGEGRRLQLFVLLHLQHLRRANMKQKWKVFQWLKQKVFLINVKQKKWEKQLWNITNANDDERKSDKYTISDGERWVKINVKLHVLCLWLGELVGHNETSTNYRHFCGGRKNIFRKNMAIKTSILKRETTSTCRRPRRGLKTKTHKNNTFYWTERNTSMWKKLL